MFDHTRYMYWTDWVQKPSAIDAKIMRAYMDGTNREVLVNKNIQWPNGLSLDPQANKLYWCDAYTDRIESVDLSNSSNREVGMGLVHSTVVVIHIISWKSSL